MKSLDQMQLLTRTGGARGLCPAYNQDIEGPLGGSEPSGGEEVVLMKDVQWGSPLALACLGAFFAGLGIFLFAIFWGLGNVFM